MVEAGADVIEVAGHLVGSMAGPVFATRYVMEYESRLIDAIRQTGVPVIFHNCNGNISTMGNGMSRLWVASRASLLQAICGALFTATYLKKYICIFPSNAAMGLYRHIKLMA